MEKNSLKWITISMMLVLSIAALHAGVASAMNVSIDAPAYVEREGTFNATVDVDNITDFNGGWFDLHFDHNVVTVEDVTGGSIDDTEIPVTKSALMDSDTIKVMVELSGITTVNGSGHLAEIRFKVEGEVGDESALELSDGELMKYVFEGNRTTPEAIEANWSGTVVVTVSEEATPTTTPSGGHHHGGSGGSYVYLTPTPTPTPMLLSGIIEAGKSRSVTFEGLNVRKISMEADRNISGVNVMVEEVDKPTEIPAPRGMVYDYLSITATNLTDVNVTAKVEFKVNKSRIVDENVDETTIKLNRYDGSWTALPTYKINEDNVSVYFEAETPGFSVFAISGEKKVDAEATSTIAPATTPTSTPVSVPEEPQKKPIPGFGVIVAIASVLVAVAYIQSRKRR
ncbi:MAG: PGF-pre-PGF domain-containing protein [Nitrospiraceae bacterium]|nr:PGF-pre-PGF domain-containing protein [Nitrospiraceae bacterium]